MATGSRLIESAALANGLKPRYLEQGDPSGVAVVLLHAFADSWRSFERLLPCLPRSIRAFTVTQRGHGDVGLRRRVYDPTQLEGRRRSRRGLARISAVVASASRLGATN